MTVEQPWSPWPLFQEEGAIHCPACESTDVTDTTVGPTAEQLSDMHVSEAPNFYTCNNCGNPFMPVDALGHPERSLPYT